MAASSSSFPSSFSISSTSQRKYDVFLSFRGEDTRNTLVDFLNYALRLRGIYIFKDDEKLEGGKSIKPELLKAIEESRFAVVILSEHYASSTWCLDELVKIVDCRKEKGMTVLPIFYNVDPSDVRKQTGTFAKAFDEHEKQFKEKVGTYRDALKHVADIAGHHQDKNRPLSEAVKWIVGRLSHISSFEFSQITEGLVGIDSRLVELGSCLAFKDDVRFIGIWAMGGMGKTTLASVVYRMVSKEFDASCFIDEVRKKDELSLQKALITQILLEKILIKNKYDGADMIKKILWDRKVLLVLDDVDDLEKLKMLVRKSDRFGSGSRIIITTRDKHLLKEFPLDEDEIFEVEALNSGEAHSLFYSKAFKKEQCRDEYFELSESFLEYVNGLPLALEVLGSFLLEKSTAEWKSALEMLKEDPGPKINHVLKISFDGLPDPVKDIFIDIACLFNHEEKDRVVRMLDSIGRHSLIGLRILSDKSLLKMSNNNELWMHNLVEDMGRNMVRQESLEPGERSRLWLYKDIVRVLKNSTGTGKVQAIDVKGAEDTRIYHEEKLACWNPNAFLKMQSLKFLRTLSISLQLDTLPLPNNLSYLECDDYPLKSLHSLPAGLVELRLLHSKIELLWEGMKIFEKLKFISVDGSSDLIISPNFSGVPNLEELILAGCSNLPKLHPSIGKLKKLRLLDLKGCQELTCLPDKFELESLVTLNLTNCLKVKKIPNSICSSTLLNSLDLSGCSKLDKLPEDLGSIVSLEMLDLSGTDIKELPSSVEFLTGLTSLHLNGCKEFVLLPSTICSLKSLLKMDLSGCSKFANLPENLGNMESLKWLFLGETAIKELPSSSIHLKQVQRVCFKGCQLSSSSLTSIPRSQEIDLSDCNLSAVPEGISQFSGLECLLLDGCKSLRSLSNIPSKVDFICVDNCTSLERLPELPYRCYSVQCFNCFKLADNIQNFSNMFQGQISQNYIIPGKEIPKWFEEVNICDTSVGTCVYRFRPIKINKVKIQLPWSGRGIVFCVLFLPTEQDHNCDENSLIQVDGYQMIYPICKQYYASLSFKFVGLWETSFLCSRSENVKVELHHLWLVYIPFEFSCVRETPAYSVDKKGGPQVEFEIGTCGMEEEIEIGFRVV